jgi:hypothetical protein
MRACLLGVSARSTVDTLVGSLADLCVTIALPCLARREVPSDDGGVDVERAESSWSALGTDAFYPVVAFPLDSHIFGNSEFVTFDLPLTVIDNGPPVNHFDLELFLRH